MGKKKKVLVVGGSGWGNVGDDLIAVSLVHWAAQGGAVKVLVAGGPLSLGDSASLKVDIPLIGTVRSRIRLLWALVKANSVVIGGGGLLDDRVPDFYRVYTRAARASALLRKPYSFVGIGVGPVRSDFARRAYSDAARNAANVWVRDEESKTRLIECGVERSIEVVSDPVLWLDLAPRATQPNFDLCVNLRAWEPTPGESDSSLSSEEIVELIAEALSGFLSPTSRVALISMSRNAGDDDSKTLEELRKRLSCEISVYYEVEPAEAIQVIGNSAQVLSMRLHGCLLATALGVPAIGLAYDPKLSQQAIRNGFRSVSLNRSLSASQIVIKLSDTEARSVSSREAPMFPH